MLLLSTSWAGQSGRGGKPRAHRPQRRRLFSHQGAMEGRVSIQLTLRRRRGRLIPGAARRYKRGVIERTLPLEPEWRATVRLLTQHQMACRQRGQPRVSFLIAMGDAAIQGIAAPSLLVTPLG